MSNQDLINDVIDELAWDPKLDADEIAVNADDGVVTLRGTVGSLRKKREAKKAAGRVHGVRSVKNDLEVHLLNEQRREDADVRRDVLQAFALDTLIPSTIDANAHEGFVTLTGSADWEYQREEATFVAGNVLGVVDVFDDTRLNAAPKAADVKDAISNAFRRNAALDADDLAVTIADGTVTVEGAVNSWSEHDEAVSAAWAAPGVTDVEDRILVEY
ncbi:MAG TPA: BON domain-containing protein [Solirubrobacteraceae bacterium]|nr:BON domain-containing protein [Solirubrobacteraceae bacterium]